jgi:hypothetical protein
MYRFRNRPRSHMAVKFKVAIRVIKSKVVVNTIGLADAFADCTRLCILYLLQEGSAVQVQLKAENLSKGVASVECNIPAKKATITPKPGAKLSPRELWEALDRSGEAASKLDGPSGLFTSKPEK